MAAPSHRKARAWIHLAVGLVLPAALAAVQMARVWDFTVDDAYISYRYARNFARGLGLVYNPGERIEGYTNFLWTVVLGAGIRAGLDPNRLAKVLGALCALATMVAVYRIDGRLRPRGFTPCLANWFLATSAPFTGYAVFGLETAAFTACIAWGTGRIFEEEEAPGLRPLSGLWFAAAALLRPEAPMLFGLACLRAGRAFFGRRNLLRIALFSAPVLAHLAFRRAYYGLWVPFTFVAKTGDPAAQFAGGKAYVLDYLRHTGPIAYGAAAGAVYAVARRNAPAAVLALCCAAWTGYVAAVGGDWMKYFRFFAPIEPLWFLLATLPVRAALDHRFLPVRALAAVYLYAALAPRPAKLRKAQRVFMVDERFFWRNAAGQTADWLLRHERGVVAIGDLGYVGYATDYPVLDLLGLVDPVIGRLPGGYTRKIGPGFTNRIFSVMPRYLVFILGAGCDTPHMAGSRRIYTDPRFAPNYRLAHELRVGPRVSWCIFEHAPSGTPVAAPPPPPRAVVTPRRGGT